MKSVVELDSLGLKDLSRKDLMSVEGGGIGTSVVRMVFRVLRDAAVYESIKYVARRMSSRRPSNLPPNYYCE